MHHPILFGILAGVIAAKFVLRMHWRRQHGHRFGGCAAGACGGPGARWARWGHRFGGPFGGAPFGFGGFAGRGFGFPGRGLNLEALIGALDLNRRQEEAAVPLLRRLYEHLGSAGVRLEVALQTLAAETFDRARAEALLSDATPEARKELVDGLEHVHDILIPEQRALLREQLGGRPQGAAGPGFSV